MEVEFFTIELREITGQKLAIWPNMSSRCKFFWKAVRRRVVGTSSPSGSSPLLGAVEDFFSHVKLSAKNGAKLASRKREYCRFCLQASNVIMVSFFVRDHCFGDLLEWCDEKERWSDTLLEMKIMACKSSLNRPQDRKTRRCLDQRDGSQALGDVGKESLPPRQCWRDRGVTTKEL